jgi:hypothetical protein
MPVTSLVRGGRDGCTVSNVSYSFMPMLQIIRVRSRWHSSIRPTARIFAGSFAQIPTLIRHLHGARAFGATCFQSLFRGRCSQNSDYYG